MNLISEHNFSVAPGEAITIRVTPVALQTNLFAVMLDGQTLQPSGGDFPVVYYFTASQQGEVNHVCALRADFTGGAAAYDILVEGSFGGGEQFSMRENDSTNTVELRFYVTGVTEVNNDVPASTDDAPPIIIQGDGIQPPEPWD
jgi:hypothetical protein